MSSVLDAVEASIKAIKERDPEIRAWESLFEDEALRAAERLDRDPGRFPLQGLVVGVKDIFGMAGRAPGNGSTSVPKGPAPAADATLISQLRAAGAVIAGTTKLTEFCWYRPCDTRNPHDLAHTPGGSSSGSAAAVAAGMVPVAIGTQTNGSVIRPASFCGVYGFKPSFGVLSTSGMTRISRSLDHAGIFARDTGTLLRVFEALAPRFQRPAGTGHQSAPPARDTYTIGVLDVAGISALTDAGRAAFDEYTARLAEQGHTVRTIPVPEWTSSVLEVFESVFLPEAYGLLGHLLARNAEQIGPEFRSVLERGSVRSLESYLAGLAAKDRLEGKVAECFGDCDLIVMPSALGPAPEGLGSTGDPRMSTLTSLAGIPCASIPVGTDAQGLPLGVQVCGRKYDDLAVLSALTRLPSTVVRPASWS